MESQAAQQDYSRVKEDLQLLQEDLASLTRTVAESQKNHINSLRSEVRRETEEALEDARRRGDKAFKRARKQGDKVYRDALRQRDEYASRTRKASEQAIHGVESRIGEHPFMALVAAFSAGLLVGKMTSFQNGTRSKNLS